MKKEDIFSCIKEFCKETHGSSNYHKDDVFILGQSEEDFAPLSYLSKKVETLSGQDDLLNNGFVYSSYDHSEKPKFKQWFEKQFSRKLLVKRAREIQIMHLADDAELFNALEIVHKQYELMRKMSIIINGKNLPVQLGEWFAKVIFGLKQVKSTSQRGFDFELGNKRIEVKVHWSDQSSPKGVKIKRSAVGLSEHCIIMYVADNFMIRDICFLDSDFILRKFTGKGHTIFLKDTDIAGYFFSRSDKHFDKVVHKSALMKFANPTLAIKLTGRL